MAEAKAAHLVVAEAVAPVVGGFAGGGGVLARTGGDCDRSGGGRRHEGVARAGGGSAGSEWQGREEVVAGVGGGVRRGREEAAPGVAREIPPQIFVFFKENYHSLPLQKLWQYYFFPFFKKELGWQGEKNKKEILPRQFCS